jgi:hypothetical protein
MCLETFFQHVRLAQKQKVSIFGLCFELGQVILQEENGQGITGYSCSALRNACRDTVWGLDCDNAQTVLIMLDLLSFPCHVLICCNDDDARSLVILK